MQVRSRQGRCCASATLYWHVATAINESVFDVNEEVLRDKSVLRGGGARYLAEVATPLKFVATDPSQDNVAICAAAHEPFPPCLRYELADATSLRSKFDADEFDVLLCVEAVADMEDTAAFVESARKVLKPNGLILLCDAFMPQTLHSLMDSLKVHQFKVDVCTDIGKWVRATGFSPVEIGESHSVYGVAACTYMRIVARKT